MGNNSSDTGLPLAGSVPDINLDGWLSVALNLVEVNLQVLKVSGEFA